MIGSGSDRSESTPAADECGAGTMAGWVVSQGQTRRGLENASALRGIVWRRWSRPRHVVARLFPARSVSRSTPKLTTMLSAIARRTVARAAPRAARNYASEVQQTANAFVAERAAIEAHAGGTYPSITGSELYN
jgi:hypothetical protein